MILYLKVYEKGIERMKRISKLLSVVLALVLTLAIIPVSSVTASAAIIAPEIKLVPSKAAAQIGDVITVDVTAPKNSRLCGLALDIIYNKAHFELIEATSKYEFDVDILNPEQASNTIRFVATDTTYIDDDATTLFTMKFKVRSNCRELYAVVKEAYVVDENDKKTVGIEIHSGRNRIVRRIFEHLGYKVMKLDRVFFAGLTKKNLPRGRWRFLSEKEINLLRMKAFE